MFSVVRSVLLRPLPYPDPDRLLRIRRGSSAPDLRDLTAQGRSFEGFAGYRPQFFDVPGDPLAERLDGSGYPDGMRGEKIPLGSRILAVCDAFAAMTSERPWRMPMSDHDALVRLHRESGSRFDPDVVEAFAACLNSEPVRSTAPVAAQ